MRTKIGMVAGVAFVVPSLLFSQAGVEYATAPANAKYAQVIQRARANIDSLVAANNVPGISVAVSVNGKVVWSEGFGMANVETQTPVTPLTKFRIGSISKSLTAAGVGLLVERGRLDLDAPIQRYVSSFPRKPEGTVTTRQLGGHLGGVRHYGDDGMNLNYKRYPTVTAGLDVFKDDPLLHAPGSKYSYSSYGWNLISAIMEGASGESFLPFMYANVFGPLGMRHTVADHVDSIIMGRTGYYGRGNGGWIRNEPAVDNSYKWAGGGFLSTPEDLLVFAHGLMFGNLLKPATRDLLWTEQKTTGGEAVGYGIGFSVDVRNGRRMISHGGGSVGGNSWLGMLPDQGVAIAITSNISGSCCASRTRNIPVEILMAFAEVR